MTSIFCHITLNSHKQNKFQFRLSLNIFIYIFPEFLISIIWSLIITLINQLVRRIEIDTILISIILGVISFLLVFRTNTAYDKYLEACKLLAEIENSTLGLVNLSLSIWNLEGDEGVKNYILVLLKNYCKSVRDMLRELNNNNNNNSSENLNATDLIGSLLTIDGVGGDNSDELKCKHTFPQERPNNNHNRIGVQNLFNTANSQLNESLKSYVKLEPEKFKNSKKTLKSLEIIYQLNRVFMKQVPVKNITNPVHGQLITWANNLTNAGIQLNRIKLMSIPKAYTAHLYQSLIIFHILLPLQTLKAVQPLPYLTLLISGITSFVLFGTLAIGERIEDPLGNDNLDLPLDEYCNLINFKINSLIGFDSKFNIE